MAVWIYKVSAYVIIIIIIIVYLWDCTIKWSAYTPHLVIYSL